MSRHLRSTIPKCFNCINLLIAILKVFNKKMYDLYNITCTTYRALDTLIRGGGFHPDFFVKLDFEIAVDQQTRAHDQTFEGLPDFGCPPVPAGQTRPYLVNFCQITLTCSKSCFGLLIL